MRYQLSMLDKCPLEGGNAHNALLNTIQAAQAAEKAGFKRFWVAEHHNSKSFASSAPEVLVSYLLAATQKIRIGTGGIMLQHYSPYKVAEVFNVLSSLAPGRVDIGIGKAPGGLPAATQALQIERSKSKQLSFKDKVNLLSQLLGGNEPTDGIFKGVAAMPQIEQKAQGFLLGASIESAELAAKLGWKMSYAGHLNGDEQKLKDTFKAYNVSTKGDVPKVALSVVVANSQKEADERAAEFFIYKIRFSDQSLFSLQSYESALNFAQQLGRSDYEIEKHNVQVIAGTPESISKDLYELQRKYGITEFMLEFPESTFNERIYAIESLAFFQNQNLD